MYLRLFLSIVCLLGCANFAHAAPFAYIANSADNTVSVIDTATNTVTTTVTVDQMPYGVAVNPSGGRVYVSNQTSKSISVIDTATNAVAKMTLAYTPGGLAVNPAGTRLYVANTDNLSISVIDINPASVNYLTVLNTATVGQNIPDGVAMRPVSLPANASADNRIYVTSFGSNTVSVFDAALLETNPAAAKIGSDIIVGTAPKGIAVTPDGTKVYVANLRSNSVSVIDTSSNTVSATIDTTSVGTEPYGVAINSAGTKAYVSNSATGYSVSVIAIPANTVTQANLTVGASPYGIAVTPAGTKVLTANALLNNVSIIDATTTPPTETTTKAVGRNPYTLGNFIGPELVPVTLTVIDPDTLLPPGAGGTITPADKTITVNAGAIQAPKGRDLTLNITPQDVNFGSLPVSLTVNGATKTPAATYTILAGDLLPSNSVTASFRRVSYSIIIVKAGNGTGTVKSTDVGNIINCGSACSASFPINNLVSITGTYDPGSFFQGWEGGGCSGNGTCSLNLNGNFADINGNYTITARFGLLPITTLKSAYTAAANPGTVNCAATYNEDFNADAAKTVTLNSANPTTTMKTLTPGVPFTITSGTLIFASNTFVIK